MLGGRGRSAWRTRSFVNHSPKRYTTRARGRGNHIACTSVFGKSSASKTVFAQPSLNFAKPSLNNLKRLTRFDVSSVRYAQELGLMRAAEVMSKIIEEKDFFEGEFTVNAEVSKTTLEEYMLITEENYATPSEKCLQMIDEDFDGPSKSA
uniref:Uncharacterized protein n=1 Tax=Glossina palpalis gambiensis TaxID=67801 RepID=A0A1B0C1P4_9MUSC